MGGDSGPEGHGRSGQPGRGGGSFAGGMPGFQGGSNRDGGRRRFGFGPNGLPLEEMFGAFTRFGDKEGKKRKGSNRHISTAPTKNPFSQSLLGGTALASTAAPTLLG